MDFKYVCGVTLTVKKQDSHLQLFERDNREHPFIFHNWNSLLHPSEVFFTVYLVNIDH